MKKLLLLSILALTSCAPAIEVIATAYSMPNQITATGTKAGNGQIAVSRDLLSRYPYGSKVKLVSVRGSNCNGYPTLPLKVTDTMAAHVKNTMDVHLPSTRAARSWGRCIATVVKVR